MIFLDTGTLDDEEGDGRALAWKALSSTHTYYYQRAPIPQLHYIMENETLTQALVFNWFCCDTTIFPEEIAGSIINTPVEPVLTFRASRVNLGYISREALMMRPDLQSRKQFLARRHHIWLHASNEKKKVSSDHQMFKLTYHIVATIAIPKELRT
jgi:hypothetical protein